MHRITAGLKVKHTQKGGEEAETSVVQCVCVCVHMCVRMCIQAGVYMAGWEMVDQDWTR